MHLMKKAARLVFKNPIAFGVIGVLAFFWIVNLFKSKSSPRLDMSPNGSKLTDAQALSKADTLHQAMKNPGTDEEIIFEVLKNVSMPDFAKIYKFFGNRIYNVWMGSTGGWLSGDDKRDLIYWLSNELDDDEKNELMRLNPQLAIF